jgi:hypothetical protein
MHFVVTLFLFVSYRFVFVFASHFLYSSALLTPRARGCLSFGWVVIISRLYDEQKRTAEPNHNANDDQNLHLEADNSDEAQGLLVGRARSATFFLPTTLSKLLLEVRVIG